MEAALAEAIAIATGDPKPCGLKNLAADLREYPHERASWDSLDFAVITSSKRGWDKDLPGQVHDKVKKLVRDSAFLYLKYVNNSIQARVDGIKGIFKTIDIIYEDGKAPFEKPPRKSIPKRG